MKHIIYIIVLLAFLEPGYAVDNNQPNTLTGNKELIFAMPGKEPMTVNPETGEIKVITPKIKLEKGNQE